MKLDVAMLSRQGARSRNEDACGYWSSAAAGCWVVADGAGGHGGGDVASRTAVATIVREFAAAPLVSAEAIAGLIRDANRAVLARQPVRDELADMRSTVVVLMIDCLNECARWGHVGDSRFYVFREGRLCFQSRDHSVMQHMIDAGYGDAALLRSHPQRGVLLHALGVDEPMPESPEDVQPLQLCDGDALLLCTDGFWESVDEALMVEALARSDDAAGWLSALEARVLQCRNAMQDNYSAIAVRIAAVDDATRFEAP